MTIIRWLIAGLVIMASCGTGRCDGLVGQASVIDGDTLKFTARAFDFGASTRRRARSSAVVTTACSIAVERRPPTISMPLLTGAR